MLSRKFSPILGMLILCHVWVLFWGLTGTFCYGANKDSKSAVFSLSVYNERLAEVLEKVSKASGYKITINEGWRNKTVSVRLENVTAEEGLKSIIEALGRPSHLMLFDQASKRIEIVMISGPLPATEQSMKVEQAAPYRGQKQIGPVGSGRSSAAARSSVRRIRERPLRSPVLPEDGPDQPEKRQEIPTDMKPQKKGSSDMDSKAGEASGEILDSPDSEELTPETRTEGKEVSQRRRRPPLSNEENPDSAGR